MNIKRAFSAGALTYIASLIVGIILAFIFDADATTSPHPVLWIIGMLGPIVFAWIFATWYFRAHVSQGRGQGFVLGLIMLVVGFILDTITVLPAAKGFDNAIAYLGEFYSQWTFWITAILVVGVCVLVGGNVREVSSRVEE